MITVLSCSANRELLFGDEKRKSCWLPADDSSPWKYCRHCTFSQKNVLCDEIVRRLLSGEMEIEMPNGKQERIFEVVRHSWFKDHCAHPASKMRLYHILLLLKTHEKQIYHDYLRNPRFISSFVTLIQTHRPSHNNMSGCKLICELAGNDLHRIPRHCPYCLYYLWNKHLGNREYYTAYSNYLRNYETGGTRFLYPTSYLKDYIRYSVRIGELGNIQTAYIILYRSMNQNAQVFQDFLQDFLLENGETLNAVITMDIPELERYRPHILEDWEYLLLVVHPAHSQWKQMLKVKCDAYKEDLMIKTCHPRRLFKWILDIDELKDFEQPFDESILETLD